MQGSSCGLQRRTPVKATSIDFAIRVRCIDARGQSSFRWARRVRDYRAIFPIWRSPEDAGLVRETGMLRSIPAPCDELVDAICRASGPCGLHFVVSLRYWLASRSQTICRQRSRCYYKNLRSNDDLAVVRIYLCCVRRCGHAGYFNPAANQLRIDFASTRSMEFPWFSAFFRVFAVSLRSPKPKLSPMFNQVEDFDFARRRDDGVFPLNTMRICFASDATMEFSLFQLSFVCRSLFAIA